MHKGRRSYSEHPPPTDAQVRAVLTRIVQRHADAKQPDLELLPDPDARYGAYPMVGYLLSRYARDGDRRAGHSAPFEVVEGDMRDLQLLQRYIESRGAYEGLKTAHDTGVSWSALADGVHIESASTPSQRFERWDKVLGSGKAVHTAAELDPIAARRAAFETAHGTATFELASEFVVLLQEERAEFDYASKESRASLLWVVEQVDEWQRAQATNDSTSGLGNQLTTALHELVGDLEVFREAHSEAGLELLDRASKWRKMYRRALHPS